MLELKRDLADAAQVIKAKTHIQPKIGLILGSGLGDLADHVQNPVIIHFSDIPHFPVSTVPGHAGYMVIGELEGKKVMVMRGRIHFYEGYTMKQITFPVRLMKAVGVSTIILTNASGGINPNFSPGDLMLISDHINLQGTNPLIGPNDDELGPRFPDMTNAYDKELQVLAEKVAAQEGIPIQKGVYAAVTGPNYETIAEIKYLSIIGVDAIGMSTVPEAIVAAHAGLKTLGLSCITDVIFKQAGVTPVSHEEVLAIANRTKPRFIQLLKAILREMP
jgi:purine-nucleoside phosphorylase